MNIQNLLEKQAMLDSNINNTRERTIEDIRMSMIAEIIEFNEEFECSHKTWKHKEIDKTKQLEEFVDILFFILQELNLQGSVREIQDMVNARKEWTIPEDTYIKSNVLELIYLIASDKTEIWEILSQYLLIANMLGYSNFVLEHEYRRKWNINMDRIGAEWR